jgi:hypothetical protein
MEHPSMTTPTNYRAALAELLAAVQSHLLFTDAETTTAERRARRVDDAMNAARALLAAPEAVGVSAVTLEQVDELCAEHGFAYDDSESLIILRGIISHAIARYGTAHPAPVPVGERPWERDAWRDKNGRCWWTANKVSSLPPSWWLVSDPVGCDSGLMLPHWALPLPPLNTDSEVMAFMEEYDSDFRALAAIEKAERLASEPNSEP